MIPATHNSLHYAPPTHTPLAACVRAWVRPSARVCARLCCNSVFCSRYGSLCLNGQYSCEGPLGQTSLLGKPTGIEKYTRVLPKNVDPADVAKKMYGR